MKTREEEIEKMAIQAHKDYASTGYNVEDFKEYTRYVLEWADEHPISGEQIAAMKNEIKFLKRKLVECDKMYRELQNENPWRDAKKDPPKDGEWCLFKFTAPSWSHGLYEARQMPNISMNDYIKSGDIIGWMPILEVKQ